MSAFHETAQVSEEDSGSTKQTSRRKNEHTNPVVSRTVEFQGMTRSDSEDGAPVATSSQTSDISGDEEERSVDKGDVTTLKLPKKKKGISAKERSTLRKGKWTPEEDEYTSRIIHYFSTGLLILPDGYTLRSYLAEKLNCDPMRITKKYAGAACLGRRAYQYREHSPPTVGEIHLAKAQLDDLEHRFRIRVDEGYSGHLYSSTTVQQNAIPSQGHFNSSSTIDQMNSVLGLQSVVNGHASNTRQQHADNHNQIPAPTTWSQSPVASMFRNQLPLSMPQQQSKALEIANYLVAQNQADSNLIPVLAQLLSTADAPPVPITSPYQMHNANSSAALLPLLASILGSASVTPQAQAAGNATHLGAVPLFHQMSQSFPPAALLPQMLNAPPYGNAPTHVSHVLPSTYVDANSQGKDQSSDDPFLNQLRSVYDLHVSSFGKSCAPMPTNGQQQCPDPPHAVAAKTPVTREPISSAPTQIAASVPFQQRTSPQGGTNDNERQTGGSILVGFLSSLKESYLKALHTPDEEHVEKYPRTTMLEQPRVLTVTDASTVSQHGSSTEEVDWNPDRRIDPHAENEKRKMGNSSSKGPPRKRHKQKQQARRD